MCRFVLFLVPLFGDGWSRNYVCSVCAASAEGSVAADGDLNRVGTGDNCSIDDVCVQNAGARVIFVIIVL